MLRVEPQALDQLLHPVFDPKARKAVAVAAKGLPASPGAATGAVVFTADDAVAWAQKGKRVLLVRKETMPDDIHGMNVAQGILTATGGMTSHAAVVGRQMGKPSVVGCGALDIDAKAKTHEGRRARSSRKATRSRSTAPPARSSWRRCRRAPPRCIQVVAGQAQAREVAALPEVREAADLGRRVPPARRPRQRRHPARRQGRLRLRRPRHRPVPHRAHVLRRGPPAATW